MPTRRAGSRQGRWSRRAAGAWVPSTPSGLRLAPSCSLQRTCPIPNIARSRYIRVERPGILGVLGGAKPAARLSRLGPGPPVNRVRSSGGICNCSPVASFRRSGGQVPRGQLRTSRWPRRPRSACPHRQQQARPGPPRLCARRRPQNACEVRHGYRNGRIRRSRARSGAPRQNAQPDPGPPSRSQ